MATVLSDSDSASGGNTPNPLEMFQESECAPADLFSGQGPSAAEIGATDGQASEGGIGAGVSLADEDGSVQPVSAQGKKKSTRFRLNLAEKIVVAKHALAFDLATKNGDDFIDCVSKTIVPALRDISVHMTLAEHQAHLQICRDGYRRCMRKVEVEYTVNFIKRFKDFRKSVRVVPGSELTEDGIQAEVRAGGKTGDGQHIFDQHMAEYAEAFRKTIAGTGDSVGEGKKRVRDSKDSKAQARVKRVAFFKDEAKAAKDEKQAEKAAMALHRSEFNAKLSVVAEASANVAACMMSSAAAMVAMANFRMNGTRPDVPLALPSPANTSVPPVQAAVGHAPPNGAASISIVDDSD